METLQKYLVNISTILYYHEKKIFIQYHLSNIIYSSTSKYSQNIIIFQMLCGLVIIITAQVGVTLNIELFGINLFH